MDELSFDQLPWNFKQKLILIFLRSALSEYKHLLE